MENVHFGYDDILNQEKTQEQEARNYILNDMIARGLGAILWGSNLFGSTDYPLIDNGETETSLKGFRLAAPGKLVAVIAYPENIDITGVKSFTPEEADQQLGTVAHDQGYYTDGGTPEQWEIAEDCYKVALKALDAEKDESKLNSWW